MADCISERRNSWKAGAALTALALLPGAVYGAERSSTPATAKVTAVRFWSLGDLTRISIEVSSDFKYRYERLSDPDRLVFDVRGARLALTEKGRHVVHVGDGTLKQIRVAETQPGVTRVVLDLDPHDPAVTFTASQLSSPDRLVVELKLKDRPLPPSAGSVSGVKSLTDSPVNALAPDLHMNEIDAGAVPVLASLTPAWVSAKPVPRVFTPPAEERVPLPELSEDIPTPPALPMLATAKPSFPSARLRFLQPVPDPPQPQPRASGVIAKPASRQDALPAKTRSDAPPSLTRALGLKLGRVVIDAGHGGHDAGTHGPSGLLEKDVVLDVALRLGALLNDRLGTEVVYTRMDDTYIPLEQRTQIANEHRADLFLSIHANSSPYKVVGGVETYYLNFTSSKAELDLAAKENASSHSAIFDLKDVLAKIALRDKLDESREFALRVQNSLFAESSRNNAGAKNRGVKKAPFVVLIGASMPSVLAEIGFLTNATDEAQLRKPEQRQKIAEALYKGIASYADSLSHFQMAKRD